MRETKFKKTELGKIPEDWDVKTIDDIKGKKPYSIAMGPFGSNITKDNFLPSGVPVIRGGNLNSEKFNELEFVFISEAKADSLKSSNAFTKDIVITHRGTLGQVGIIPVNSKYKRYVVSQSQMKMRCDESIADPDFVFYYLRSPQGQYLLLQNTSTTGIPAIAQPLTSLKKILIPLPNLQEQRYIASLLGTLDDKIALNRSINTNLEAIGQALFKHWFVDFEFPDGEGRPYRSSGGEMVETELGDVPKGWRVSKVGKELETILGGTPDRTNTNYWTKGTIPWINSGKVNEFRIIEPTEYITKEAMEKSATKMLPKRTTVLAITGATLGQVSILEIGSCANQSVVGILESEIISSEYIYFWTKHIIDYVISWQTGGAQQHINKENINNSPLLVPDNKILIKYAAILKPIFDKIASNSFESLNLSKIRDALLPKLMSGEVRVMDAEGFGKEIYIC